MRGVGKVVGAVVAACALLVGCQTTSPSGSNAAPGNVKIYAAASLQAAFTEVIKEFSAQNPGITVETPVYDGSSTLVTQLTEGAKGDIFASADEANMDDLVKAGLNAGDPRLFATNTLVIAVPRENPLKIKDLGDLGGRKYAVCAAKVPCGRATAKLFQLQKINLAAFSQEQNVTAVAERVISGEVDAGLVYATDVASRSDKLSAITPSQAAQVINKYPITVLKGASPAAQKFCDFVISQPGQEILRKHGFGSR